ncbi:MAG: peptidoglycan-associated lipoprotein Pal [Pseudomonadota bacterium]
MITRFLVILVIFFVGACTTTSNQDSNNANQQQRNSLNNGVGSESVDSLVIDNSNYVVGTQSELTAVIGDRVFFEVDSSNISREAQGILDLQIAWLNKYNNLNILIEGHCDNRGTREYNIALGARRANAVKEYMVNSGVDGNRISTISFGKERPAMLGSSERFWSKNRRAVVVVK